jgi:Large polyvalent protein associated domain 38
MSLTKCLKKLGIAQHETAILRGDVKDHLADGHDANAAARFAVQSLIDDTQAELDDFVAQVRTKAPHLFVESSTSPTTAATPPALASSQAPAANAAEPADTPGPGKAETAATAEPSSAPNSLAARRAAAASAAAAKPKAHPRMVMGSRALAVVSKELNGLSPGLIADLSHRFETRRMGRDGRPLTQWRNPPIPGIGPLFRAGGSSDLTEMARVLEDNGYLPAGSLNADYGTARIKAQELIQAALNRDEPQTAAQVQAEAEATRDTESDQHYAALDAESRAEAEAERAAIMAEVELTEDELAATTDDDIPFDTTPTEAQNGHRDQQQQAQGTTSPTGAGEDRQAAAAEAGGAGPAGSAAQEPAAEQGLTAPTPESLRAAEGRSIDARRAEAADQKRLADKAKADAERGEFTLTGSQRPADVAAAAGQGDLLARALSTKAFYAGTKYDTPGASAQQARDDAIEVLGFDPKIAVLNERRFDKRDRPMRYELATKTIYYNTAAPHSRATDLEGMVEEFLHAADHIKGLNTISASNDAFLPGGAIRTEIEAAMQRSAAMKGFFEYPLGMSDLTDTQKAAELFARIGAMYHGWADLLKATAPKAHALYARLFDGFRADLGLQSQVRKLAEAGVRRRPDAGNTAQERGAQPLDRGAVRGAAPGGQDGAAAGLQALRERVVQELGGEIAGGAVEFRDAGASLETRSLSQTIRQIGGGERVAGQTTRAYTPQQLSAFKNVGFQTTAPTLEERARSIWKDAGKKLAQGLVDQFAPVKNLDKAAYTLLRLSKGASGAFETLLQGGKLKLTDGVYDFDDTQRGGVLDTLLKPLQGEHHDFFRWVAANRAERLTGEGKEHLFTPADIAAIKSLADGVASFDYTIQHGAQAGTVTRDRTLIYADSLRTFNEFNKNVLDMAEQSGLIDGAARRIWEHEFYVPFYRVADEGGGVRGMNVKSGVVRQQAFKALKGGKQALNADLLENTLMNWSHLIDAAAKNRAAKATIEAAERMGVAAPGDQRVLAEMANSINSKTGVVWFMDAGRKRYSLVDDPYVLAAISSLEYAGMRNPMMKAMGAFKHALTIGVTTSPFFKVRNLIRDSVSAIGTSPLGYNPAANVARGWALTDPKSDAHFQLLAGGGTIHFGTMMEGNEAKRVQALVESGVDASTILGDERKVKAFYRKFIEPGITAYNELGNRGEEINRAALYSQLVRQGVSHAEASLQARDLMDFSMQGTFTSIRFLTQVVPFFNARIQGLYKLGRAAKQDPARFSAVIGAAALLSLGLLAAYRDDDDWKKREEWDRNNYWWFKFGGTAFRIPKPFEIGAIATLAERGFELAFDKEMTGKRFRQQVMTLLGDNLSMNPIPQLVKPILDVYANKNSFTGQPIESMGMERLDPTHRFTDRTSMAARGASTAINAATNLVGAQGPSPLQIDHLLRGYFGWLGSFVVGAGDVLARPATGQASQATPDYWKSLTGGIASNLEDAPSRYVTQMYQQAKEVEQAYGTWRALLKQGKMAEASAYREDHQQELSKYRFIESIKRRESRLNEISHTIQDSNRSADEKRELLRNIQTQKDRLARGLAPTN